MEEEGARQDHGQERGICRLGKMRRRQTRRPNNNNKKRDTGRQRLVDFCAFHCAALLILVKSGQQILLGALLGPAPSIPRRLPINNDKYD